MNKSSFDRRVHARRRGVAAAMLALVTSATSLATVSTRANAAAARTVPPFRLGASSVAVNPGGAATVAVLFGAPRKGTLQWVMRGLPSTVSASIACSSSRRCDITVRATAAATLSTADAVVAFSAAGVERTAPLRIVIPTGAPAPLPPAPTPTTAPPAPTTTAAAPKNFTLRANAIVTTTAPGGDVAFPLLLTRDNWLGPIALTLDALPTGWRAAFLPANPAPQENVSLIVSVPTNAANGDYPIRMHAASPTMRADATLVVRVRTQALSLTLTSAPAVTSAGSTQFVVDVRPLDDSTLPITMSTEGLPAGVTAAFSANPAVGLVALNITVPPSLPSGSYAFTIVAARSDISQRLTATLSVPVRVGATFLPTPVAGTGTAGYSLSATPGAANVVAGGSASFDVTVVPVGGFADPISLAMSVPAGWGVGYVGIAPNVFRVTVTAPTGAPLGAVALPLLTSSGALTASLTLSATVVAS